MRLISMLAVCLFTAVSGIETAAIPVSDGFDPPVRAIDGRNWTNAQDFGVNCHLGEDWNWGSGYDDYGKSVYAVSHGTVSFVQNISYSNSWGKCIILAHQLPDGSRVSTLYAHLSAIRVSEGDNVSKGQDIGAVGDSNGYWPSHLHFELRVSDALDRTLGVGYKCPIPGGWTDPSNFIDAHRNLCTAANVWWTSTPTQGWYHDEKILYYSASGTNVNIQESPGGADGVIYISEAGQGWRDYSVRAWNGCGDVTIHWQGGWDTVAPVTNFSGPATSTWLPAGSSVGWNPIDTNWDYVNNRVLSTLASSSFSWDNGSTSGQVPEGIHKVTVSATDSAGNNITETHGPYWLDTVAPSITVAGPAASTWISTPQVVTWNAADATSGIGTKLLTWDTGTAATASPTSIPEGKHAATVTATDVAGNAATPVLVGPYWIDTLAPAVTVALSPALPNGENGWYTVEPTMEVSASDPNGLDGSGVDVRYYSIDGMEQQFISAATVAGDGVHACAGKATDVAGNFGETAVEVKVDTTAPVFTAIHSESESGALDTLSASWECDDPASGVAEYEYSIYHITGDTGELVAGPFTTNLPYAQNSNLVLARGESYYFVVRARNNAGLYSNYIASEGILATESTRDVAPGMNSGGTSAEARTSENYLLLDTLGQFVVDTSTSANFIVESGYWHSELTTTPVETVAMAKSTENNKLVQLGSPEKPVVVTVAPGVFTDRFYVEQPDRTSGIAVQFGAGLGMSLVPGDRVWILGTLNEVGGERVIQYAAPSFVQHSDPLGALFVSNSWLGGSDLNSLTRGIAGAAGLNNIGLLIKTSGRISNIDANGSYFYINDGSNLTDDTTTEGEANVGVRVAADGRGYTSGQFVVVTGVSSCFIDDGGRTQRLIRPVMVAPLQ